VNVFISYARADYAHVRRLSALLKKVGVSTWLDTECLDTHGDIKSQLAHAIAHSSVLILLDTKSARLSPWVAYEVDAAIKSGTPIIRVDSPQYTAEQTYAMRRARPNSALQLTGP
jgi:hypothetical protein